MTIAASAVQYTVKSVSQPACRIPPPIVAWPPAVKASLMGVGALDAFRKKSYYPIEGFRRILKQNLSNKLLKHNHILSALEVDEASFEKPNCH